MINIYIWSIFDLIYIYIFDVIIIDLIITLCSLYAYLSVSKEHSKYNLNNKAVCNCFENKSENFFKEQACIEKLHWERASSKTVVFRGFFQIIILKEELQKHCTHVETISKNVQDHDFFIITHILASIMSKTAFLSILEMTCFLSSKAVAWNFFKNRFSYKICKISWIAPVLKHVLSCIFREIFEKTCFVEYLQTAASDSVLLF